MTRTTQGQSDDPGAPRPRRGGPACTRWSDWFRACRRIARRDRLLFLDDDPLRAERFLEKHPRAVWVTNVTACLALLSERWDEVHLDHDLGGKTYVDSVDADCGMEVIRWLCREPRPHLKRTLFFVHTHNATAGLLMVLQMHCGGYRAEYRPFGLDLQRLLAHNEGKPAGMAGIDRPAPSRGLCRLAARLGAWGDRLGLARCRAKRAMASAGPGGVSDRPRDPGP